ncbi:MAG TPA: hypothetical protein PLX35_14520, partial [Cyclobacteriaceae bacterium]|nr:hypothetical protein [Cyclobacteriaceae bacterium]
MIRIFTLLTLCLVVSTTFAQDVASTTRKKGFHFSFGDYGIGNFNVQSRGKIEISDDDKDVKSISSDGYLEITKTVFGSRRSLVITPSGTGLKREYYEGRSLVPFEPE